jgi:hypothetical protein
VTLRNARLALVGVRFTSFEIAMVPPTG